MSTAVAEELLSIPWIESPFFEQRFQEMRLDPKTADLVRRYAEQGYLVFDPEISNFDEIAQGIVADLEPKYANTGHPIDSENRMHNAWQFHQGVKTIAMGSDLFRGQIMRKDIVDVRTGQRVPHWYRGAIAFETGM